MSSRKSRGGGATINAEQRAALTTLRKTLVHHGYSGPLLRRLLGVSSPDDVGLLNHAAALERLRADSSAAATLVRLLYLEAPQRIAELECCFGKAGSRQLLASNFLSAGRSRRSARLRVDSVDGLYVLGDHRLRPADVAAFGLPPGDMVYPPGSDSVLLAGALPPGKGDVLDLCTGSGVQALTAARSVRRVVGIDISDRAVLLASCNARLNGIDNVVFKRGSLFAPVRGTCFDLIVANPPFVPGPRRGPAYHSGGALGDRVLKRIVSGLGLHLKPGGRALMVSHLALRSGESVADRVRPWLGRGIGRSLVLILEEGSPVDLAAAQAVFALADGLSSYGEEIRRWVSYLDRHRIERIVLVLLAFERRGRQRLEVVEAFQRTLPLPLSRAPRDLLQAWFERSGSRHSSKDSTT